MIAGGVEGVVVDNVVAALTHRRVDRGEGCIGYGRRFRGWTEAR